MRREHTPRTGARRTGLALGKTAARKKTRRRENLTGAVDHYWTGTRASPFGVPRKGDERDRKDRHHHVRPTLLRAPSSGLFVVQIIGL
ncbi:MAG: hypothetical protein SGI86_05850 [Deltaproteobacteria bacterium]|nr:hypothetical protein [Deltaproteobacteria bacterium]